MKKCAKCHQKFYCSKDCQVKDWRVGHKLKECDYFASPEGKLMATFKLPGFLRLLRFVLKCKFEAGFLDKEFKLFDGLVKKIYDLMNHVETFNDKDIAVFKAIGKEFKKLGFVDTEEDLIRRASQLMVNCISIQTSG